MQSRYARIAAPAAFLAAATIAVLLVRGAIYDGDSGPATPVLPTTVATTAETNTARRPRRPARRYYRIQRGDTFGSLASRFDVSVERLLELNPGVDPSNLRVGQKIRVR